MGNDRRRELFSNQRRPRMKKLSVAFVLTASLFAMSAMAADSWTGTISDSKCGAKHADASEEGSMKCAQKCVKGGATPISAKIRDRPRPEHIRIGLEWRD